MFSVVTGGAGFIGSHLVKTLLERGSSVRVVDNLSTGRRSNLDPLIDRYGSRLELVEGDIRERELMSRVCRDAEFVFHQAAVVSVQRSVENPLECDEVNVHGTLTVLEAGREAGVKKVVLASTCAIYGDSDELPKRESMEPAPLSPYAVSKLVGEQYARLFQTLYGLPVQPLRYFNVFGPGQDPASDYAAVVPRFITRMLAGEPPIVFGDGRQTRDFVFVGNVVEANLLAATGVTDGRPVNIGTGKSVSLNELVGELNVVLGTALTPVYRDARSGDVRHSGADVSLAQDTIGFEPQIGFREALQRTVDFYRQESSRGKKESL